MDNIITAKEARSLLEKSIFEDNISNISKYLTEIDIVIREAIKNKKHFAEYKFPIDKKCIIKDVANYFERLGFVVRYHSDDVTISIFY